jgi:hypothetical protein
MQAVSPDISDNVTTGAGFKGDSSTSEPAVISDVQAIRKAEEAIEGIEPESPIITFHPNEMTIPKVESRNPPVVFFPARAVQQDAFVSLQSWEGIVTRVLEDAFVARLYDKSGKMPVEEAEFPLGDVSEDEDLIQEGAVFYWNIGYMIKPSRQRIRASIIRFRRLPAWSIEELDSAREKAKTLIDKIGWR